MPTANPLHQHLQHFRAQSRMNAGSLIISLFGDAVLPRGGRIWLGSLIGLLAPLDLNERLIRTAVFRLVKEEWMQSEALGRRADYTLTPAGLRRFEESARHIYAAATPLWDRRWRFILTVGDIDTRQRERLRRALFWQGFGALNADCFVHPSTDLNSALDALLTEGLGDLHQLVMPFLAAPVGSDLSLSDRDLVARAWNLDELASAYGAFCDSYTPVLQYLRQHPSSCDDQTAFLLRTLLIHDYRRLLLRDPELPDALLPIHWPGHKARLLCKEIYRRLLEPSERHIEQHMQLADGSLTKALPMLQERFQQEDPLAILRHRG